MNKMTQFLALWVSAGMLATGCSNSSSAQSSGVAGAQMPVTQASMKTTDQVEANPPVQDAGGNTGTSSSEDDNPYRQYQLKDLKKAKVKFDNKKVFSYWIMDTEGKRAEGMMFLQEKEVKQDEGMIFVFSLAQPLSFWMRNTYIPLDIAYLDAKGKILNTTTMNALDETGHPSSGKAKYAIEMKRGAFKRNGIKAGMVADIPLDVQSAD